MANFDDNYWLAADREGQFPDEFYKAIAADGWLGIAMPEVFGGADLGVAEAALMMQKISESGGGMAAASAVHINLFGPQPIVQPADRLTLLPCDPRYESLHCQLQEEKVNSMLLPA